MKRVGAVIALAVVHLLAAAPSAARAEDELPQWGKGVFEVRDPFVLALLRQTPEARSPRTLAPFVLEVGARAVWENSFAWLDDDRGGPLDSALHRVTIDAESRTLDLVARMGVVERVELGAELRALEWRGGGVLDGMIDRFHRSFGFGALNRDRRPRDAYLVAGTENGGRAVEARGQLTGLGDGRLQARLLALEGADLWPAVSFTFELFLPVANRHLDHARRPAETISVDLSKRIGDLPLFVYAGAALTHDESTQVDDIHIPNLRAMAYVGVEWEVVPELSVVLHYWQETQRERELFRHTTLPYFNAVQYIAFGVKIAPLPGLRIELGAIENVLDPNTTGDFGFLANVFFDLDLRQPAKTPDGGAGVAPDPETR